MRLNLWLRNGQPGSCSRLGNPRATPSPRWCGRRRPAALGTIRPQGHSRARLSRHLPRKFAPLSSDAFAERLHTALEVARWVRRARRRDRRTRKARPGRTYQLLRRPHRPRPLHSERGFQRPTLIAPAAGGRGRRRRRHCARPGRRLAPRTGSHGDQPVLRPGCAAFGDAAKSRLPPDRARPRRPALNRQFCHRALARPSPPRQ